MQKLFCLGMGLEYAEEHERVFNDTVNPRRTFLCKKTPVFFFHSSPTSSEFRLINFSVL